MRVNKNPGELLLHPLRLRIVQALVNRPLTTTELLTVLDDVAQATLYRHVKQLEAGGLLEVVEERPVRGGVERTFAVVTAAVSLSAEDLASATDDEHFRYFATFIGTLLSDFAAYLGSHDHTAGAGGSPRDLAADRVGYRQVPLWLTDDEFDELAADLRTVVEARLGNEPTEGRRRRLVSTIFVPDDRSPT